MSDTEPAITTDDAHLSPVPSPIPPMPSVPKFKKPKGKKGKSSQHSRYSLTQSPLTVAARTSPVPNPKAKKRGNGTTQEDTPPTLTQPWTSPPPDPPKLLRRPTSTNLLGRAPLTKRRIRVLVAPGGSLISLWGARFLRKRICWSRWSRCTSFCWQRMLRVRFQSSYVPLWKSPYWDKKQGTFKVRPP
jgi:hypothetical protein